MTFDKAIEQPVISESAKVKLCEVMGAIEGREINLNYVFYSPIQKRWEVYLRVPGSNCRAWTEAVNFYDCCQRLMEELP